MTIFTSNYSLITYIKFRINYVSINSIDYSEDVIQKENSEQDENNADIDNPFIKFNNILEGINSLLSNVIINIKKRKIILKYI